MKNTDMHWQDNLLFSRGKHGAIEEVHLSVKFTSYEKYRPEDFSATFNSLENSLSIFFCQSG